MALVVSKAKSVRKSSPLTQIEVQKYNPNHDSQGRFASGSAGGVGGAGSVVAYDEQKDKAIQEKLDKVRAEQRELEKKYKNLSPRAIANGYTPEDEQKWRELDAKQTELYNASAQVQTDFLDGAIKMESGGSAADGDFGFKNRDDDLIRDEYVVPDELTLKTNAGLRRTGRVTSKVERFDSLVNQGEIKAPTRVYRSAILTPEQTSGIQKGSSFVDRGFQSTAFERGGAEMYMEMRAKNIQGEKVLFEYTLQPKVNAINVGYGEIVVQRSAKISVTDVSKQGDVTIVKADVSK